jgi:hypothetical protein
MYDHDGLSDGVRRRKGTKATPQDAARRKTIHNIERRQTSTKRPLDIEPNFNKVFKDAATCELKFAAEL